MAGSYNRVGRSTNPPKRKEREQRVRALGEQDAVAGERA